MSQTKKQVNRFSTSEKRKLDKMVTMSDGDRRSAIRQFVESTGRNSQTVAQYIRRAKEANGIIPQPKKKAAKKASESIFPSGEIRFELPIKRIEFENGKIIIIAERN